MRLPLLGKSCFVALVGLLGLFMLRQALRPRKPVVASVAGPSPWQDFGAGCCFQRRDEPLRVR